MKCRPLHQLLSILILAAALLVGYGTTLLAGTCPEGIIAYWSLEESGAPYQNWIDADSGMNAICSSQCPTRIGGAVSYANRFGGGATGLQVPSGNAFNWTGTDIFSVELWVRRTAAASENQVLLGRTDGVFSWIVSLRSNGTVSFTLQDASNSIELSSSKVLSTSQSALGERWHHIAVIRDGSSGATQLFVDGLRRDSETGSFGGGFSSDSAPLAIGWSGNENNPQRFIGDLDEIAVYGRALTLAEIRSHYYLSRQYCAMYDYPVDIMPLGDSITYEDSIYHTDNGIEAPDRIAYRWDLWQSLNNALYWVDFVGSEEAGWNVDPTFDPDNSGYPGITTEDLLYLLQTSYNQTTNVNDYVGGVTSNTRFLPRYPSDVILLHIGTNGLEGVANIAPFVTHVSGILDEVDSYETNITVIVARIIHNMVLDAGNFNSDSSVTHQYNDALEQMVNERIAAGDKLLMVDMEDGAGIIYVLGEDMVDTWHPSESGYNKMADQWFARLEDFLPQVQLPQIDSEYISTAVAGSVYEYQVTASGTPKPYFSLENGPSGMTIDDETGLITWDVPDSAGDSVSVRVVAANIDSEDVPSWGNVTATQSYSISIRDAGSSGTDTSTSTDTNTDSDKSSDDGGGCFIQSAASGGGSKVESAAFWGIVLLASVYIGRRRRMSKRLR